jgi:hypothetical protein
MKARRCCWWRRNAVGVGVCVCGLVHHVLWCWLVPKILLRPGINRRKRAVGYRKGQPFPANDSLDEFFPARVTCTLLDFFLGWMNWPWIACSKFVGRCSDPVAGRRYYFIGCGGILSVIGWEPRGLGTLENCEFLSVWRSLDDLDMVGEASLGSSFTR